MNDNSVSRIPLTNAVILGFALTTELEILVTQIDETPHFATQNFSRALVRATQKVCSRVSVISTVEISNFPQVRKVFFFGEFHESKMMEYRIIGFINIIFLKHVSRLINLMSVPVWQRLSRADIILVHGTHSPFMIVSCVASLLGKRSVLVLTDEHGYRVDGDGWLGRILRAMDKGLMSLLLGCFSGYICLNPRFISKFSLKNARVFPGIVSSEFQSKFSGSSLPRSAHELFNVLYAGRLDSEGGVLPLLSAVQSIPDRNLRIVFIGKGPLIASILDAASRDPRISYGGVISRDDLLQRLCSADLLVNPRQIASEVNNYSFPSKLIEFLASGTPTITGFHENIPTELHDAFIFFYDDDIESLVNAISSARRLGPNHLRDFGARAATLVHKLYSEEAFARLIYDVYSTRVP